MRVLNCLVKYRTANVTLPVLGGHVEVPVGGRSAIFSCWSISIKFMVGRRRLKNWPPAPQEKHWGKSLPPILVFSGSTKSSSFGAQSEIGIDL